MARCPAAEPPRSSAIRLWRVIEFFEDDVGILADDRRRSEYPARRSGELEEAPWLLESMDRESAAYLTFTGPPSDATYSWTPEWRRAEIGAANGHGNARSVAKIQSVVSNGGEVNGVKLLSPKTVDLIFQEQSKGIDLVLGIPIRWGIGYALPYPEAFPYLPHSRICFWGGWGGSMVINDLDRHMTFAYMMNKMESGIIGGTRSEALIRATYAALEEGGQRA